VLKNDYWRICALRQKVGEIDPWSVKEKETNKRMKESEKTNKDTMTDKEI
jgi:hypothetical protein